MKKLGQIEFETSSQNFGSVVLETRLFSIKIVGRTIYKSLVSK